MKVDSTELPPRQVSLAIEVEQERLDRAMDDAYRRLAGRSTCPDSAAARAPRPMVERMHRPRSHRRRGLDQLLPAGRHRGDGAGKGRAVHPAARGIDRVRPAALEGRGRSGAQSRAGRLQGRAARADRSRPPSATQQVDAVIERLRESYAQWAPVERAVATRRSRRAGPARDGRRPGRAGPGQQGGRVHRRPRRRAARAGLRRANGRPEAGRPEDVHADHARGLPATRRSPASRPSSQSRCTGSRSASCPRWTTNSPSRWASMPTWPRCAAAIETAAAPARGRARARQLEDAAMNKLVEISTIEFPPQLVDHEAQHMLETFTRNVEQQGIQLPQYLRMHRQGAAKRSSRRCGPQAETRVRALAGAGRVRRRREDRRRAPGGRGRGPTGRGRQRRRRRASSDWRWQNPRRATRPGGHARTQGARRD